MLEAVAEFSHKDPEGLRAWLRDTFSDTKGYIPAVCGFTPRNAVLRRNASINPRRLAEPGYLPELVNEYARRESLQHWRVAVLNPKDGTPLDTQGVPRPGLLFGIDNADIRAMQEKLVGLGILPRRLELSTLPLIGGVAHCAASQGITDAIVICLIEPDRTHVYIMGKDGVHTPDPLQQGLDDLIEATAKEYTLATPEFARIRMESLDEDLLARSRRLVRPLARQLKPAVDYYELQTGQRVGAVYCANLPARLAWIGEALAASDKLNLFQPDCAAWCEQIGLRVPTDGSMALGPRWLGPLSQIAHLTRTVA